MPDTHRKKQNSSVMVQDLHSITPYCFLEVSGAAILPISYQQEYENRGKESTFLEVYEEIHRKKKKNGTREDWIEMRAKNAYEEFQKSIEDWRQTQPTSEDGTMVQPSPADMTHIWIVVVSGPKKGRTYGAGVLQSSTMCS
ncbi:uncharacterized protein LOC107845975 isoform X2 [Capsicum annuum]|uniref:uncharacterized protein LOC107845975 isoform X2 n=1 Tax=Capsicum annuum TaxID=4072 RepID=UPI001FB0D402|nr:uncharacterized protein LOC107845975 isoform X2 [Capsicum annuum]